MSGAVRAASPVERSEVDCPICRQQVVEENPSCLSACGHGMCRACAVDYVERELRWASRRGSTRRHWTAPINVLEQPTLCFVATSDTCREARLPIPCPCCKASTAEAFGTGGASSSSREPAPAGGALTVAELHELLGTADMACFYDVSLKVYVAAHRQELYVCPTASCDYVADVAGWTHEEVKCPRCLALACPACSSPTHPGGWPLRRSCAHVR